MNEFDYYAKPIIESVNQLSLKKETWLKSILLLASSLFGILIALHNTSTQSQHIRLCFALAIVLLGFGILTMAVSLYSFVYILSKHRDDVLRESLNAHSERRALTVVATKDNKIFGVFEKTSYICFVSCIVLLSVYALLIAL